MVFGRKLRLNPYILGQIEILLAVISVIVLMIPRMRAQTADDETSAATAQHEMQRFHGYALPIAFVGLAFGVVGLWREKPPLLPISAIALCAVVVCGHYIAIGFSYLTLAVFVILIAFVFLEPFLILLGLLSKSNK